MVLFNKAPYSEIENYLHEYVKYGWCEKKNTELESYEELELTFKMIEDNLEDMIKEIIDNARGLKRFLLIHSHFRFLPSERDWFDRMMAKLIQPDKSDIDWFINDLKIPDDLLEKFKIFDIVPARELRDNVIVTYKLWGNFKNGEQTEPILVTDLDFEESNNQAIEKVKLSKNVGTINCSTGSVDFSNNSTLENDEVPF